MASVIDNNSVLKELFETKMACGLTGGAVSMHSNIPLEYAEALYRTVLANRPALVLEVGMAFGISSLAILTALHEDGGGGRLISIDPYQTTQWKGCGILAVKRSGLHERHELIEEFDYIALPKLLGSGLRVDLAYIDGRHTFDYTLLDCWYLDKMLDRGGVIGFNDCGWPAVHRVISFLLSHRKYEEMDVGLPLEFADYTRFRGLLRRVTRRDPRLYFRVAQDRYFRKAQHWEPNYDFFSKF